jgi:preprotein translocase subunit SecF
MKIMKIVLLVIIALIITIIAVYAYYGGFKKINFSVEKQGGEILVYENMIGDYKQTPAVSDKVYYSLLNDYGIVTTKGFGIYYDNPKEVEKSKLRSEIGCIVENLDSVTIDKLSGKFQIKTQPYKNYITTKFPFKGKLSIMFGIMKVYPALEKYLKEQKYPDSPVMEIYDIPNKKIIYRKEIIEK